MQDDPDNDVPVATKGKGKEKSTVADARNLSIDALHKMVDEQVRNVAELTGLKVRSGCHSACSAYAAAIH